jgi:hypothetical protein
VCVQNIESRVCARWVPQQLTDAHKKQHKTICVELLTRFDDNTEGFLACIITRDETWLHHFKSETKTVDGVASCEFSAEKEVQGYTFQGTWGGGGGIQG